MQKFLEAVKNHLSANMKLFATVSFSGLTTANKSISILTMPTAGGDRYFDKSSTRPVQFQILTKSPSQLEAMNDHELMAQLLEGAIFFVPGYQLINVEVVNWPSWLEETETNEFIYTSAYRAELMKRSV